MNKYADKSGLVLTIIVAIMILVLSILPSDFGGETPKIYFKGMDKIIHGIMYGLLTFLVLHEDLKQKRIKATRILLLLTLIFLYSVLMELIQYFLVETRSGDPYDALANLGGIFIATIFILLIEKIRS